MIIAAYAGTGKSTLASKAENIKEIFSMPYSWILPKQGGDRQTKDEVEKGAMYHVHDPRYPYNFVLEVLKAEKEYGCVIIPSVDRVIKILQEEYGRMVVVCYPEDGLEEEYRQRYIERGNTKEFLKLFVEDMYSFIEPLKENTEAHHIVLHSGEYLLDRWGELDAMRGSDCTKPVTEDEIKALECKLEDIKTVHCWLSLSTGENCYYCKVDIDHEDTRQFVYKMGRILGSELCCRLSFTESENVEKLKGLRDHKIVDKKFFEEAVVSYHEAFLRFQKTYPERKYMTFRYLKEIMEQHHIPENVHLISDSGWECGATDMMGVFYHEKDNILVFTQFGRSDGRGENYREESGWKLVSDEWDADTWLFERCMNKRKGERW